jgi:hypothetical protein
MGDNETIVVKSHSNISKTVTKCLLILNPQPIEENANPAVVKITADAKAAGKAITITEIVKRRILEHGGKIKQSTTVQERSTAPDTPISDPEQKYLKGEGFEKTKKRLDAQIVIQLEREG